MFDCKDRPVELSSFVGGDVRQLIEVDRYLQSYSEPMPSAEDEDHPERLFGVEFYYLDDEMLQLLALEARTSMCHLGDSNVWQDLGNTESWRLGAETGRFFRILIGSLVGGREEALYKEEELLEVVAVVMNSLPGIGKLAEGFGGISVKRIDSVSYGYFHVALEWRWYGLLLVHEVRKRISGKVDFEAAYRDLLDGLVRLAFIKFNDRATQEELTQELQFYCPCVKNVWIGMLALASSKGSGVDFWACLQTALEKILNEMQAKSLARSKANALLFQVWLVHGIASLYQYRLLDEVTFKETPIITLPPDYTILDRVLKEVNLGVLSEDSMRTLLLLLKPIYTKWWPTKYELVITLWEYFSKRLNSPFQLPNEPPISLACVSRSPKTIIEQANHHSTQEAFDSLSSQTSSFKAYITLMTHMIRHLSNTTQKTKVQILFNRTILRFAPPKLTSLTEQAIYNYTLLTLAMVQSTPYQDDYPRLSKQMLHFNLDQLAPNSDVEVAVRRITVLILANMALTTIFTERGFDKTNHLRQVLEGLSRAYRKFGDRLQTVAPIIAEAMGTVYERAFARGEFEKGDEQFLTDWLERYLKSCAEGDLEVVMKVFTRTFECLRRSATTTTTTIIRTDFLDPLNAYVLPRVKEFFTGKDSATSKPVSPIVAELAAQFTLCAPDSAALMAHVSFFAECPTAGLGLRLAYIRVLVGSDRVREIDGKVIVRIWLKLAISNGGGELEDFSRVVCGLEEFQAICSIAEVDLCMGKEDLMGVFFKAVGDTYNGKDSRGQMEMSLKMNALFNQFDAWFVNPTTSLLIRIMSMLVVAIKECSQVIYKRGNSACLFHVAFSKFFLPTSVLTNRNVPNDLVLAMGKVWHRIMDVLGQISYAEDAVLGDYVSNMMSKWAPQFLKFKTNADAAKPFLVFFTSRNEAFVKFAFNKYLTCYVELNGATPKPQAETGLKLLSYLLEALNLTQDNGKISMFIRVIAPPTLDHALLSHDQSPSKLVANDLISQMLACTQNGSNLIKMELKSALSNFTKKHLRMDTSNYFRFMYKLADQNPEFIESLISTIRLELTETERLRGNGEDKHLRRMLMQLQGAVEASFNKVNKRALL